MFSSNVYFNSQKKIAESLTKKNNITNNQKQIASKSLAIISVLLPLVLPPLAQPPPTQPPAILALQKTLKDKTIYQALQLGVKKQIHNLISLFSGRLNQLFCMI